MSNDISLTQALGGLRIANPDNSPAPSPLTADAHELQNPPRSSHSSSNTVTPATARRAQLADLGAESYVAAAPAPSVNRTPPRSAPPQDYIPGSNEYSNKHSNVPAMSMPPQAQYPAHPAPVINQPRSYGPVTGRAIQGIYNHPNASGGSQTSSYSAYRYGDEPPQPIVPPNRSSSRVTAGVQSSRGPEYAAANNNLPPPRRSSRRISPAPSAPTTPGAMVPAPSYMETTPLHSSEEWKERGAAVAVRKELDPQGRTVTKIMKKGVNDFDFGRSLGEGSYSTVVAATDRTTQREYAIKILDKRHIIKEKKVKYVNIEKDTLNRLNDHPGIVRLFYTFQDERSLYFVLDLAINGELLGVLKKTGTFDEECTRFYGAQILDAIEYMHHKGVLHRDLKPENVLLDANMHVKITDFGTGKMLDQKSRSGENGTDPLFSKDDHRAVSFVGTAEYVSPELLTAKEGGKPTDLWAFGCIIYQLLCGRPPFKGATEYLTFDKILKLDYSFPPGFPPAARDLVERLLVPDPSKRLTVEHVKNHPFFEGTKWGRGLWKQPAPRLKPYVPPAEPIRLNPPTTSAPTTMALNAASQSRPHTARLITELPAPSQLDIEWSPVLTRQNERILQLGNLVVTVSPQPHNPHVKNAESSSQEAPRKFSRFFMSGNTTKKRQRLVMITSSARIIIAASGGDEKKAKMEISLLGPGTTWRSFKDGKGLTSWCVDTREKHILFEPPPSPLPEPDGTAIAAREWTEALARARELALTQQSLTGSYSGDSTLELASSQMPSPAGSTIGPSGPAVVALTATAGDLGHSHLLHHPSSTASTAFYASNAVAADGATIDGVNVPMGSRATMNMRGGGAPAPAPADEAEDGARANKGRKRFSRRQSKGGLAAVF